MEGDFRIGDWLVRPDLNRIEREGEEKSIVPKVMDVLVYLADHAKEVLPKERIIQAVWSDTFVTDDVLKQAIFELRKAFKDDARKPTYIETIPRRGYHLIAAVVEEAHVAETRYRVLEEIGHGAMGKVFLAEDQLLKRKVALKFLVEELAEDEKARELFLREARAAAALDHPYVCSVHDTGELEGRTFIAMEYLEGQTLKERMREGPLPIKEALKIASEVAEALEKAHHAGIVHRDLKPANIMLTSEGHSKVMDFGLAKQVLIGNETVQDLSSTLTREGAAVGTLSYMSPEQVRGDPVDHRSNIFSFGIVLYEMLTGVHPFRRDKVVETTAAILNLDPTSLAQTQAEATSKEEVLRALDSAATRMRQRLGESLASIEAVNTPLWEATTSSLEALKAYRKAGEMNNLHRYRDAVAFAERAVELDPDFASAHIAICIYYGNLGEDTKARAHGNRAFELRDHASELERFAIEQNYHASVTGDLDKSIQVLELATQTYPEKDEAFWNDLAAYYARKGQHEKALECQLREASLPQGETIFGRSQLARRYIALRRFSEAKTTLETAISEEMENTTIHWNLYVIAFLDGDEAAMKHHADWVEAHPDDFGGMEDIRITEAYISGRLQEARGLLEDRVFILQQQNRDENAANMLGRHAWWESIAGCHEQAQVYARNALEIAPSGRFLRVGATFALAATGATREAEKIAASVSEEFPQSTIWLGRDLPTIQANIELWKDADPNVPLLQEAKAEYEKLAQMGQ